jgi:flavoprotein
VNVRERIDERMNEERIHEVVVEVLKRLLPHMGATGERGTIVAVFTGATAGYREAVDQVRSLILEGYRVELVFSHGAEALYAKYLWGELEGFPHVATFSESDWLRNLKDVKALVVPVLSLDTLSKLSLLLADNFASNVILHALFAGKPVVMARNGTDPSDKGRKIPHFDHCAPLLAAAIEERFQTVGGYGCRVTDVNDLAATVQSLIEHKALAVPVAHRNGTRPPANHTTSNIITAGDVLRASHSGAPLRVGVKTIVTPLARELAYKHHVELLQEVGR